MVHFDGTENENTCFLQIAFILFKHLEGMGRGNLGRFANQYFPPKHSI